MSPRPGGRPEPADSEAVVAGVPEPEAPDEDEEGDQRPGARAPLDFFSLEPLAHELPGYGDDEDEDEETDGGDAPATRPAGRDAPRRRGGGSSRGGRGGRGTGSRQRTGERDRPGPSGEGSLDDRPLADLHDLARRAGIPRYRLLRRADLIAALGDRVKPAPDRPPPARRAGGSDREAAPERSRSRRGGRGRSGARRRDEAGAAAPTGSDAAEEPSEDGPLERREGLLELMQDGFGFVRVSLPGRSDADPYVSRTQVEKLDLRTGDQVTGSSRAPRRSERNPAMVEVAEVNGRPAEEGEGRRPAFGDLSARRPSKALGLGGTGEMALRMVEIVTPVGMGQRALVHGPRGAGASTLLRTLAQALIGSEPVVIAAVVDARPEELPDWEVEGLELYATTAEHTPLDQVRAADLALERAKRLAEAGHDVVLLIDSITRLARAHGQVAGASRGGEGGADAAAVHGAKRVFAAARATEAGSLTILAAARSEAGSGLDAEVYEELAGSANLELRLDADLAGQGLFPAIDIGRSRTLNEETLVGSDRRARLDSLRGPARALEGAEAWQFLAERLRETGSNDELLERV